MHWDTRSRAGRTKHTHALTQSTLISIHYTHWYTHRHIHRRAAHTLTHAQPLWHRRPRTHARNSHINDAARHAHRLSLTGDLTHCRLAGTRTGSLSLSLSGSLSLSLSLLMWPAHTHTHDTGTAHTHTGTYAPTRTTHTLGTHTHTHTFTPRYTTLHAVVCTVIINYSLELADPKVPVSFNSLYDN